VVVVLPSSPSNNLTTLPWAPPLHSFVEVQFHPSPGISGNSDTMATLRHVAACLAILLSPVLSSPAGHARRGGGGGSASDVYDYIVVGSGPGGAPVASNLVKAGYSVLLLEAGDDQSADLSTQIPALGLPQFTNRWDFYVRQYADEALQLKNNHLTWRRADGSLWVGNGSAAPADATLLGVYYPRGATLGGSSVINAGVSVLPPKSDWDYIAALTGDNSWR